MGTATAEAQAIEATGAEKPEAKAEKPEEAPSKKESVASKEAPASPAFSPWIFVALLVALVVSAVQQAGIDGPQRAQEYWKELTGPHVVPPPKASKNEVVIQFCQSCGTNGLYNQISQIVHKQASRSLSVRPAAYPPHPAAALAAQVVTMAQFAAIGSVFAFDKALPEGVRENKLMACFGLWMGGSMIGSSLTKTSAFEIYLGRELVWSSLKHHRMPNLQDLIDGFAKAGVTINA